MISNIIGRYLLSKGLITSEQLFILLLEKKRIHIKMGLIAVEEGFMTQTQAELVYDYQSVMDKKFGEIAIEKGYLTEWEVESLLDKQGDAYLAFAQALSNQHLMNVEQLEECMREFQREYHLTLPDMEDLKSNDADRILPICMPAGCMSGGKNHYLHMAGTALRTLIRLADGDFCPKTAYFTKRCRVDNGVLRHMGGEQSITCGIVGRDRALVPIISALSKKRYREVNEEALAYVGELLNSIEEIYAGNLRQSGILLEKEELQSSVHMKEITAPEMLVLPLHVMGEEFSLVIAEGNRVEMIVSD